MSSCATRRKQRHLYHAGWEIVKQCNFLPGENLPFKGKCIQWTASTVFTLLQQQVVVAVNASLGIFIFMC